MDLSTLQKTCENTNLQQQKKNQEKAMEKLRETILKLSNKEPNVPLSQTQNSVLREHLNCFLSGLHSTPVHPPYTWALQELDEEGGSSEDSISEFIKKEHHSLPWAHMTLLKHHLHKMIEKGEIVMIDGGRFLLPGDSKSMNPRRKMKRKRRRYSSIKQKKRQQKQKEEDTQNEVHLEQPIKQHRGRSAKYKVVGAKIDGSTTSALATTDPHDEVPMKERKNKRRGRALKGQEEDGADPDATLLKDLRLPQKLTKTSRSRKAQ